MNHLYSIVLSFLIMLICSPVQANPKYSFKIASLAPEGSIWINHFRDFAKEVEEKSNGEVRIKIYPGGVMGDDMAMYRKMRVGQLQGGGFTMSGIANVVPDFRVMAIPFFFQNYKEVDVVSQQLTSYFKQKFDENGLELLYLNEVGFVYGMSTTPTVTIDELKQRKSWIPSGDPLAAEYLKTLGVTPVPLTIPDVLSSLQTGLVDTVYTSLYGSLVMQWFTKAIYITDFPYGYAYGAIALSKKSFAKLPAQYATMMHELAHKHFSKLNEKTRQSNEESREVLKSNGVTFIKASPEVRDELVKNRDMTVAKLVGKSFSEEAYRRVIQIVDKLRATP